MQAAAAKLITTRNLSRREELRKVPPHPLQVWIERARLNPSAQWGALMAQDLLTLCGLSPTGSPPRLHPQPVLAQGAAGTLAVETAP